MMILGCTQLLSSINVIKRGSFGLLTLRLRSETKRKMKEKTSLGSKPLPSVSIYIHGRIGTYNSCLYKVQTCIYQTIMQEYYSKSYLNVTSDVYIYRLQYLTHLLLLIFTHIFFYPIFNFKFPFPPPTYGVMICQSAHVKWCSDKAFKYQKKIASSISATLSVASCGCCHSASNLSIFRYYQFAPCEVCY